MFKKFTKTNILTAIVCGVLLAGLTISVVEYMYATTQSVTASPTRVVFRGVGAIKAAYTFVNAKDTLIVPIKITPNTQTATRAMNDTTLGVVIVRTQRAANTGTAASIGVRWGYSCDDTAYTYSTIGTDSTTWATFAGDSANSQGYRSWATAAVNIGPTAQAAWFVPYNRVMIWGGVLGASNGANVKVEVYWIPKYQ